MTMMWKPRRIAVLIVVAYITLTAVLKVLPAESPSTLLNSIKSLDTKPAEDSTKELTYLNRLPHLSQQEEREARTERLHSACAKEQEPEGKTENILVYDGKDGKSSQRMSYCVVPKAGCTFWIRVFRFLNNDTAGLKVRTPFDIDRLTVHDVSRRQMKMYRLEKDEDRAVIENSTRFMFARDPYSRIWASYIDKLLLPDQWLSTGKEIISRRPNASAHDVACGSDVRFREFVEYVVEQIESRGPRGVNGHWRPIKYVCDPCLFKPIFLGKQESFMADSQAILEHFGLQHLMQGFDKGVHVRDEVSILTDYNYLSFQRIPKQCDQRGLLARRLWTAFRLNGLVSPFADISVLQAMNHAPAGAQWKERFKQLIFLEQEKRWNDVIQNDVYFRTKIMQQAYSELPTELLEKFVAAFDKDFELFGYEKRPEAVFGHRRKQDYM